MSERYVWGEPAQSRDEKRCHICEEAPKAVTGHAPKEAHLVCATCGFKWCVVVCGVCLAVATDPDGTVVHVHTRLPWWECPCHTPQDPEADATDAAVALA